MPTAFHPISPTSAPPRPQRRLPRAVSAALWTGGSLAAITLVKIWARDSLGSAPAYLLYVAAIIIATWTGGWVAGVLATAAATLLATAVFMPVGQTFTGPRVITLVTFVVEGMVITTLTARMNVARDRASRAMREARESLGKLEGVLRGVGDGITVQSAEGRLIYANDAAARLTGFDTADELMAASVPDVLGRFEIRRPEGGPFPSQELPGRLALAGRPGPERLVRFHVKATGDDRWALVRANAVRIGDGEAWYAVNVFQDVTESRLRDEALRVSREWFSTTLRSIGDAVIATDARGRVTFMNPLAETLTGWTSDEAAQKPLVDMFRIVDEDTRAPVESPVDRVLRDGQLVSLADRAILIARDGREVAIDDSAAPIRPADGAVAGTVLVFRDVSQKRADERRKVFAARATAELASSLDYRKTLAMVSSLAVPAIADWCAFDMVDAPPGGEPDGARLHRLAVQHVDPEKIRLVYEIQRRYPEDPASPTGASGVARSGRPVYIERIPDGALAAAARDPEHLALLRGLELRSYIAVPIASNGSTIGVLSLATAESGRTYTPDDLALATSLADRAGLAVTQARLFEEATGARDEAERANRAKDEFLAMLGHELRNPLAPLLTTLQLMERRAPDVLTREREVLARQVRYMVTLVDDLLDVSRIARGKIEIQRERVELADTVARAFELAGPLIAERRHTVTRVLAPGCVVTGDPVRLAQVIANLVMNAAKYTEPAGHITVTTAPAGDEVVLTVRDTGVGIAAELLPRVFELFVQSDQPLDRAKGGLGLGLAIVKSVVELHGGRATAESAGPGQGSTFEVRLPARREAADAAGPEPAPQTAPARGGVDVLVVDDNVDALEILTETLALSGYRPHGAADAAAALSIAAAVRPAIALLDIGLPVIDGYELARRLRASASTRDLKLVALTGYGQPADRERTRAAGFDAHLVKPVTIEEIERVISRLVSLG